MTTEQIKEFVRAHDFNTLIFVTFKDGSLVGNFIGYDGDGFTVNIAPLGDQVIRYDDVESVA